MHTSKATTAAAGHEGGLLLLLSSQCCYGAGGLRLNLLVEAESTSPGLVSGG